MSLSQQPAARCQSLQTAYGRQINRLVEVARDQCGFSLTIFHEYQRSSSRNCLFRGVSGAITVFSKCYRVGWLLSDVVRYFSSGVY